MPYMAPKKPVYMGRLATGTVWARMISAPEKTPAEPAPDMARPMMRTVLEGAAPQIAEPISNIKIETRNTVLIEKKV
jgi:hypothetical protein